MMKIGSSFEKIDSEDGKKVSGGRIYQATLTANILNLGLTALILLYSIVSGHLNHDHVIRVGVMKRIYLAAGACYLWWEWNGLLKACAANDCKEWQLKSCFICFWTMSLLILEIVLFHLIGDAESDLIDLLCNYLPYGLVMLNGLVMVRRIVSLSSDPLLLAQYKDVAVSNKEESSSIFKSQKKKIVEVNHNISFPSTQVGVEFSAYDFLD